MEGAKDGDHDEWDQGISDIVNMHMQPVKDELEAWQPELRATPENISLDTEAGKTWRQISERMHLLGIELYAETRREQEKCSRWF